MRLTIDFETRSCVDLRKSGPWPYAKDDSTDVYVLALKPHRQDPVVWVPQWVEDILGDQTGLPIISTQEVIGLVESAELIEAHNCEFEQAVWRHVMSRYGFPDLDLGKLACSAAKCAAHGLPRSLGKAAAVLQLDQQKDDEGHRLMLKMCKPRKPTKKDLSPWHQKREDLIRLIQYCIQDVVAEEAVSDVLRDLHPDEQELWRLDQKINQRGVPLDVEAIQAIQTMVADEKRILVERFAAATNYAVTSPSQVAQLVSWLGARGVETASLDKDAVEALLKQDLPADVRPVLELRAEYAASSTSKYSAMQAGMCPDGRARGCFMFHGAGTGRWAGRRIQPHNMPRSCYKDPDQAIAMIVNGQTDALRAFVDEPMTAAKKCLRGVITAPEGYEFIGADFSSIEGRVLAFLAGEAWVLDAYRAGRCLYRVGACDLFGVQYDEVTKDQRQAGKPRELGLGFGGGIGAYKTMADAYGIDLTIIADLVTPRATGEQLELAGKLAELYLGKNPGSLTLAQAIGVDVDKQRWRDDRPHIVAFWRGLEEAAKDAVRSPGEVFECRGVKYVCQDGWLYCRLPSGRMLHYVFPHLEEVEGDFGVKETLFYWHEDSQTGQWRRTHTYGGKLAENVVQAVARDLLRNGMFALEAAGYPIVLHVHDEAVAEVPVGYGDIQEFERLMCTLPPWATGCPVEAEGWRGRRYRK